MPEPTCTLILRSTTIPEDAVITVWHSPDPGTRAACPYVKVHRQWEVSLPISVPGTNLQFKFLCDGQWQAGPDLQLNAAELANGPHIYDDRSVRFERPAWSLVDASLPSQKFFPNEPGDEGPYDLIIVGSGAGGGTVAYDVCRAGTAPPQRVLVLEAGNYLFPVNIQNLPRRDSASGSSKGPSELWYDYWVPLEVTNGGVTSGPNDDVAMAQALNLGGRTIFWGTLAPRMKNWEFKDWPAGLGTELQDTWYERAEHLMRVQKVAPSGYQSDVRSALQQLPELQNFQHIDAPLAIEFEGRSRHTIPAGAFSTAELLIGRKLQVNPDGTPSYPNLQVRLNHEVIAITAPPDATGRRSATGVVAYDHRTGRDRNFILAGGGSVLLAAGTLATPLIAQTSTLGGPLVGRGLTDHPIYVVRFAIPRQSRWFTTYESSITLSRPVDPGQDRPQHPFNIKLSLNTRLVQSRFIGPGETAPDTPIDTISGELVFLLEGSLRLDSSVTGNGSPRPRPSIQVEPVLVDPGLKQAIDGYAQAVVKRFGGQILAEFYAPLGGVSHEVGTMRMAAGGLGVVDENLMLSGTSNVYVCDLSVFPSSPAANPTLTLVALARRLASRLNP